MKPSYPSRGGLVVGIPALVAFVSPLSAFPVVWDNSNATGDWSTAANWDTNTEPTSADDLTFPAGLAGTITTTTTENALSLTFEDSYTLSGGTLALASGNSIHVAGGITASINNVLNINGGLTKTGTGTLVLGASNTNPGGTVISGGTVRAANAGALGAAGIVTTVNGGTALEIGGVTLDRPVTLKHGATFAGTGTATSNGVVTIDALATAITLSAPSPADTLILSTAANELTGGSGSTVVEIGGPGVVRLNSASNFAGSWNLPGGTLELAAAGSLGSGATSVTLAGGTLVGRAGSGGLVFTGPAANLLLTANSSILSDRATTAAAGVNNSFGTLSMGAHVLTVAPGSNVGSGTATVTLGNVTLTGNPTFAVNDTVSASGKLTTGSLLGGAARGIVKSGAGDLAVTGGATDLPAGSSFTATGGGTIEMLFPGLGASTTVATTSAQNPFGEASVSVTDGVLRLLADGSGTSAAQTYQVASAITLGGSVTLDPDRRSGSNSAKTFELPGLSLAADTELTMSGDNTHGVRLTGPLALGGDATLKGIDVSSKDGLLTLNGGITGAAGDTLTLGGGTSPLNLTINAASTFGGGTEMTGGNVTLNAADAFGSGPTEVAGGTLIVNSAGALSGTVTLSGGTLRVNGANHLAGNAVRLEGGTLEMKNDTGATIGTSSLTVSGTSTLNVSNNGSGSSQVMTLPLLNVSAASNLTLTNGNSYTPTFTAISLAGDLTLNHAITARIGSISEDASARALVKTGTGTLELEGASSHSGGIEVLAGILLVEHGSALGSGVLTLGATSGTATATAQFASGLGIANDLVVRSGSGGTITIDSTSGGVTWSGGLSLQKDLTLDVGSSVSSYNGAISGTGAITKISGGELVLGNALNNFAGNIAVTGGTLATSSDGALGNAANNLTFSSSTTFKAGGSFATSRTLSFTSGTGNVNVTDAGHTLTLNSGITGSATLTKLGSGVLAFGPLADSSARGAINTNINAGTLRLSASNNVSDAGMITLNAASVTLELVADADTDFIHPVTANLAGGVIHVDRATSGGGSNGRHTLGAFATTSGSLTVTGDNGYGLSLDSYTATVSPTLTNNAPAALVLGDLIGSPGTGSRILTFDGTGDIQVAGSISETVATGSYAITKKGGGTLRFGTSVADFGRLTTVQDGTLDLNGLAFATDDVTLGGAASPLGAAIVTGAAGSLDLGDTLTYSATSNPPGATITGNLGLGTSPRIVTVGDSSGAAVDLTLDGPVTGGPGGTLTKNGTGVLRMSGAGNTLGDAILVSQGTLELAKTSGSAIPSGGLQIATTSSNATVRLVAAGQIDDSAPVALGGASEVILDLNGFSETVGPLSLTQSDVSDYTAIKTGAAGTVVLNGNLTLNNNANSSATDGREVLITGSGGETTPATDGTLDLGGAVRTIHVATTTVGTHEPKANATIETQIINGGILKTGPRTLFLNHPNNPFNGGLQIAEGTVKPATFASLGAGPVSFTNSGAASAVIDLGTLTGTMSGDLTVGGSGSGNATLLYSGIRPSSLELSGTITLQRDLTIDVVDGTTAEGDSAMIDITGTVDDAAGSFGLVKVGNGTLRLASGNTFSGGTTVGKGILSIAADSALGDSTAALTIDGGCFHPTASISTARDLSFGSGGGSVRVVSPTQYESSGLVTWGSGLTTFFGTGTTILSGSSSGGGGDLTIGEHIAFAASSFTPLATAGHTLSLRGTVALPAGNLKMVKSAVLELGSGNLTRAIGTSAGEVQLPTAEAAGFAAHGADRAVNFGGAGAPVVWGQQSPPFLFQSVSGDDYGDLILGSATGTHTLDFQNPIELDTGVGTFFSRNLIVPDGPAAIDARISGGISQSADPNLTFTSLDLEVEGTLDISGPMSGEIGIDKLGAGTAILSGTNSFFGDRAVYEGTLQIAGNASWGTPQYVYVEAGATLDASAMTAPITIAADEFISIYGSLLGDVATPGYFEGNGMVDGNVHAQAGAYVYPDFNGMLHLTGDFTLDATAFLDFYFDNLVPQTGFNRMRVGGTVNLAGELYISASPTLVLNDSAVLILNDGSDPIVGTFAGLPEGAGVPIGNGLALQVTYLANGDGGAVGNDFGVTVVPDTFSTDLALSVDAPLAVDFLSNFTVTYTVENFGPSDSTGSTLDIPLPGNAVFVGSTPAGTVNAGILTIPVPAVTASSTTTITVQLTAPATEAAILVEPVLTANGIDGDGFNNGAPSVTAVMSGGCLTLASFVVDDLNDQLSLGIDTIPGVSYVLQRSTGLDAWDDYWFFEGDGEVQEFFIPMTEPREFFRFNLVPNSGGGGGGETIE
jgi:autotransporter-associated beta strand protein